MAYCTLDDLKTIVPEQDLIQLTDDRVPPEEIIEANVNKAISDAGELIDGYLRSRYDTPMNPVPGTINMLATDIAVYRLYARRVKLVPPEGVADRYKDAKKTLEKIQSGMIELKAGTVVTPETSPSVMVSAADRLCTQKTMKGY